MSPFPLINLHLHQCTEGVFRRPYEEAVKMEDVPAIPVQPISYGDAIHFMNMLDKGEAPADWQGQLSTTYHIMQDSSSNQ